MKNSNSKFTDFGKKVNRAAADAKDWILENKTVAIPAGIGILAIVVLCIVLTVNHGTNGGPAAQAQGTAADSTGAIPVPEVPLEENAHPELNELFENYYAAIASGDVETVEKLKSYVGDSEKIAIRKRSEYIDYYTNMSCYTKPGPMEESFVVYVYSEAKLYNFDTLAPGIKTFLVYQQEDGAYRIMSGEMDENLDTYMQHISYQADVEELFNRVQVKYNEIAEADAQLKEFLDGLSEVIDTYVAEEIARQKGSDTAVSGNELETETEPAAEEPQETEEQQEEAVTRIVAVTDVVNVRSSDSETADKLGKAQTGDKFVLLENRENGWSKIEFEGREAFIKTEFLQVVEEQPVEDGRQTEGNQEQPQAEAAQGTVTAKTTVNVRASANENGERLGTIYKGEKLDVIMKQADGWTKVSYQGKTAYVKSEFVE